jgi:hypothetical protein
MNIIINIIGGGVLLPVVLIVLVLIAVGYAFAEQELHGRESGALSDADSLGGTVAGCDGRGG